MFTKDYYTSIKINHDAFLRKSGKSLTIDYLKKKMDEKTKWNFNFVLTLNNNKQKGRTKQHDKREKGKCNVCTKRVTTKRCSQCNEFVCDDDVEEVFWKRNEIHSDKKSPIKQKSPILSKF